MLKITFFSVSLLVGSHDGFDDKARHSDTTDYAARSSYIEGYEKFIFAVPDNNISAAEARSHRLDTEKHHPTIREMKKGHCKQSQENGIRPHWNEFAV